MAAIEQEILDEMRKLDETQKHQVLLWVQMMAQNNSTLDDALGEATQFREKLNAKYGKEQSFGVQTMLDEIREEASWPRK